MLASSPQDKKVYEQFIASRRRSDSEDRGDEVATLPAEEIEKVGSSVFHRDDAGLFLFDIARIGRSSTPCGSFRLLLVGL